MRFLIFVLLCINLQANPTQPRSFEMRVQVSRSEPVYQTVIDRIPYEHCEDEKRPIRNKENTNLTGGLIGGAVGTQIGDGKGRDAAIIGGTIIGGGNTDSRGVLGGILGGLLARKVGKGKGNDVAMVAGTLLGQTLTTEKKDTGEYILQKRCSTRFHEVPRQVLVGYNNFGSLLGQEISKFATTELKEIPVNLQASY